MATRRCHSLLRDFDLHREVGCGLARGHVGEHEWETTGPKWRPGTQEAHPRTAAAGGEDVSAFEDARDVVARDLVARPWQVAPEGSIWLISGAYRSGGTFTECLAIVLPEQVTGGPTAFAFLPPLGLLDNCVVGPDEITAAKRMVLLYANDPQETYDPDDEAYLVHAKQR